MKRCRTCNRMKPIAQFHPDYTALCLRCWSTQPGFGTDYLEAREPYEPWFAR
jgi:hypothetical protein